MRAWTDGFERLTTFATCVVAIQLKRAIDRSAASAALRGQDCRDGKVFRSSVYCRNSLLADYGPAAAANLRSRPGRRHFGRIQARRPVWTNASLKKSSSGKPAFTKVSRAALVID